MMPAAWACAKASATWRQNLAASSHAHPLGGVPLGQRRTFDQVADDVDAIGVAAHFMDAHDVRMPQLGRRAGLAKKLLGLGRGQLAAAGNFQGHHPVQLRIVGLPDGSEAADSQLVDELEATNAAGAVERIVAIRGADETEMGTARAAHDFGERAVDDNGRGRMAVGTADAQLFRALIRRREGLVADAALGGLPGCFQLVQLRQLGGQLGHQLRMVGDDRVIRN